eukprot:13284158-Heterocapsa_arctica.AAC.1
MRPRGGHDRMSRESRKVGRLRAGSWGERQVRAKQPTGRVHGQQSSRVCRHRGVGVELRMVSH